ncbi:Y-family DNA polymerase, partial [Klebsiella variicola]
MSRRVMTTLEALASRVDVYSIDEAFLDLTGIDRVVSFEPFGRQAIWRHCCKVSDEAAF